MENVREILESNEKKYTPQEIANILNVTKATALNFIKRGELKAIRISERKIFVTQKELDNFINNRNK